MKKVKYFLRSYRLDILAFLVSITSAGASYKFLENPLVALFLSIGIVFFSLIVLIFLKMKGRDFYYLPMDTRKHKDDWIGRGFFEYSRTYSCFSITQADPGYIYSQSLNWSDYKFSFDFKIRQKCLGVILRAVNLSNYVMIQINQAGIRPHIKINGGWKIWEANDADLVINPGLQKEMWYHCEITCDKDLIVIKVINQSSALLDREWIIPTGAMIINFPNRENDTSPTRISFPINLDYGSVGFRASGDEKALIKNVLIEKI